MLTYTMGIAISQVQRPQLRPSSYTIYNMFDYIVSLSMRLAPSVPHQAGIATLPFQQEAATGHPVRENSELSTFMW